MYILSAALIFSALIAATFGAPIAKSHTPSADGGAVVSTTTSTEASPTVQSGNNGSDVFKPIGHDIPLAKEVLPHPNVNQDEAKHKGPHSSCVIA